MRSGHPFYKGAILKTRWFLVIKSVDNWWVDLEGRSFGPFSSADAARDSAISYAEIFSDSERCSQVFVPDNTGRLQIVWDSKATVERPGQIQRSTAANTPR